MRHIKLANILLALSFVICALSLLSGNAQAKEIQTWWGTWDTDDYNHRQGTKPPEDLYPPSDEHGPLDSETGRAQTLWSWTDTDDSADPLEAKWVRGANRTVFWKSTGSPNDWRRVSGQFNEPSLEGVDLTRKTNKATYYFGMEGRVDAYDGMPTMFFYTDCGIAWENGGGYDGWILFNRCTVVVAGRGKWHLWKTIQDANNVLIGATRYPRGSLGAIRMSYDVSANQGTITFLASNGKSGQLNIIYGDSAYPVKVASLRRNVGLTQAVTEKEFFELTKTGQIDKRPIKAPIDRGDDLDAVVINDVAAVYLDGSTIPSLLFLEGELAAPAVPFASLNVPSRVNWSVAGGSDLLRPDQIKADDKWIVDFVAPMSTPRPDDGSHKTGFDKENVKITMGAKKHNHRVQVIPKGKK